MASHPLEEDQCKTCGRDIGLFMRAAAGGADTVGTATTWMHVGEGSNPRHPAMPRDLSSLPEFNGERVDVTTEVVAELEDIVLEDSLGDLIKAYEFYEARGRHDEAANVDALITKRINISS